MPVVPTSTLTSPPSNCFGLYQYLAQRLPGYDPSEYLREINSAYVHVWEEISKLADFYFTKTKIVTVATAQVEYDLLYNQDAALSGVLSPRLYQVTRVRCLPPAGGLFQNAVALQPNDTDFVRLSANPATPPSQSGPYFYYLTGWGSIRFALPPIAGTQIEIVYSYWPLPLTYGTAGSVSSAGAVVTGVGTSFTSLTQPDFSADLPANTPNTEQIQAEFICNGGQVYRVQSVASDTSLTTFTAISPVLAVGNAYVLAALPEVPREHIRVVGAIAMGKMYSVAGDDSRVAEWTQIAQYNIQMMRDSLQQRQNQNPTKRGAFPYRVGRGNRAFLR